MGGIRALRIDPLSVDTLVETSKLLAKRLYAFLLIPLLGCVVYRLFGHSLVRAMYANRSKFVDHWLMRARAVTPVERYLSAADNAVLLLTIKVVALIVATWIILRKPIALLCTATFVVLGSLLVFCVAEAFPAVVQPLHLERTAYFAQTMRFVYDQELWLKQQPLLRRSLDLDGRAYAPLYGIHFSPKLTDWATDENGFRNTRAGKANADVVVMGDGFVINGYDDDDTFTQRLQRHLGNASVQNFGEDGQGPSQYLEVYKHYAIKKHPKFALFAFNEGNDIDDIRTEFRLKDQTDSERRALLSFKSQPFFARYSLATGGVYSLMRNRLWMLAYGGFRKMFAAVDYVEPIHPDVAIVRTKDGSERRMVFIDQISSESPENMLSTPEWAEFKRKMIDFRDFSHANNVTPVVVLIPAAVHIYAEYSTRNSGENWLKIRDEQIAAKGNTAEALSTLCREVRLKCIDLSTPFAAAAQQGKMLYFPLITHWNSDGMETAAVYVADVLRTKVTGEFD